MNYDQYLAYRWCGDSLLDKSGNVSTALTNLSGVRLGVKQGIFKGVGLFGGGSRLTLNVDNLNPDLEDFAFEYYLKIQKDPTATAYFVGKDDATSGYLLQLTTNGNLGAFLRAGASALSQDSGFNVPLGSWVHGLIFVDRSGNLTQCYNGTNVLETLITGSIDPDDPISPTSVFSIGTYPGGADNPLNGFLGCTALYKFGVGGLTDAIRDDMLNWKYNQFLALLNQGNIMQTKRNFYYPDPKNLRDTTLIGAWNMRAKGGYIDDISGNGNTGQIFNAMDINGINGQALFFNNRDAYVKVGNSIYDFTQPFTINAKVIFKSLIGNGQIFSQGGNTQFYQASDGLVYNSSGEIAFVLSVLRLNEPTMVTITFSGNDAVTGEGTLKLYVNAELKYTDTEFTASTSSADTLLGKVAPNSDHFGGVLDEIMAYNEVKELSTLETWYNEFANQIYLLENFDDEGSDGVVKNPREWVPGTGTYKIGELSSNDDVLTHLLRGTKYMECNSAGVISLQSKQAFGTWEFDFYKGGGSNTMIISVMDSNRDVNDAGAYALIFNSNEAIIFTETDVADKFQTKNSYFKHAKWYRIKITRDLEGEFSAYIKGGGFGNDYSLISLDDGGSGANPVTDTTITSSEYFVLDLDSGDRITNMTFKKGVVK